MTRKELYKLTGIRLEKQKKWEEPLNKVFFFQNEHSWAGTRGVRGTLYKKETGEKVPLPYGGWYSLNGKITYNESHYNSFLALAEAGAKPGDVLIIHKWNHFENYSPNYDEEYYYILTVKDIEEIKIFKKSLENEEA